MTNKKSHSCPKCDKSFGSPQALGSHIGQVHNKVMTEDERQRRSEASKKNWENPEFRARQKKVRSTSKWKKTHSKKMKKQWENPDFVASATSEERNKKVSEGLKGHTVTDTTKSKISLANTGKIPSKKTRIKQSKSQKKRFKNMGDEEKEKFTMSQKGLEKSESTRLKMSNSAIANWKGNDARKKKASETAKAQRNDPEYVSKLMKSCQLKPNKAELLLDTIIQELTKDFVLNVDASVMVLGGKIPDFVNINGKKQVIELFGDYWHSENITGRSREREEQLRINHFKKFGYATLIIWENEFTGP